MNVAAMWDVLRKDFGITNREEFEDACKKFKGLDIGIFTTPVQEAAENESRPGTHYKQAAYW